MKIAARDTMPVERIKEVINYDPATGSFTWKKQTRHNMPAIGKKAGGMRNKYYYIRIDEVDYPAARIAWVIMNGEAPEGRVAFKDQNPVNLKWDNLIPQFFIKGYDTTTHEGKRAYQKAYRAATPLLQKARALQGSFGIGLREYEQMLVAQGAKCAICNRCETMQRKGKDVALAVDHCHTTGEVRGLLCVSCNIGLGKFEDSEEFLINAASYLQKHKQKKVPATNVISIKGA